MLVIEMLVTEAAAKPVSSCPVVRVDPLDRGASHE
jgi:hypothetical protein